MEVLILHESTREFIFSHEDATIAKVFRTFDLLETFGYRLGMPHAKRLEQDLHELRIRGKEELRLLYTIYETKAVILHGFLKKSMAVPQHELSVARKRLQALVRK